MNFLSHFYFDRNTYDANKVTGTVLPDLVKNACKNWNIHPEKNRQHFLTDTDVSSILIGWERHLAVDNFFHSSDFFYHHTSEMRIRIAPILEKSPARAFFVAHIALELLLDGLLLTESVLDTDRFYKRLHTSNRDAINQFLMLNNITETAIFFKFFDEFIDAAYLNSYREANDIVYALNRICMRLWNNPFNATQKLQLATVLIHYRDELKKDFMRIFEEIEVQIN